MKNKRGRIAKTTLKKKNEVGGISLPDFKAYFTVTMWLFMK